MLNVNKLRFSRLFRYVLVVCGWLLCIYEWIHVWRGTPRKEEVLLFVVLIPALLLIHAGMYLWVTHCKRLAARGRRGIATRYTSPVFLKDHLGRQLIMEDNSHLCREILVSIDGDAKSYTAAIDRNSESYVARAKGWGEQFQ